MNPQKKILLLTRPKTQADAFLTALKQQSELPFKTVLNPVVKIEFLASPEAKPPGGPFLFTSANAVQAFANLGFAASQDAFCVGAQTVSSARQIGLQAEMISERIEEGLGALPAGFCYIRAEEISFDMKEYARENCIAYSERILYRQVACALSEQSLAKLSGKTVVAPVFSALAARNLAAELARSKHEKLVFVAISKAVRDVLQSLTGEQVLVSPKPSRDAMIATILTEIHS